ncbi:MAG: hypothetical protein Q8P13_01510 [bacterium]|nr:hypothetical protein [bacterium]
MGIVKSLDQTSEGRQDLKRVLVDSGLMDECKRIRDEYAHARGYFAEIRFPPRVAEFTLRLDWWNPDKPCKYSVRVWARRRVNGTIEIRINNWNLDPASLPSQEGVKRLIQKAMENPLVEELK